MLWTKTVDRGRHPELLSVITATGLAAECDHRWSKIECENLRIGARLLTGSAPAAPPTENLGLGPLKTAFTVDESCLAKMPGSSGTCSWVKLSAAETASGMLAGFEPSLCAEKKAKSSAARMEDASSFPSTGAAGEVASLCLSFPMTGSAGKVVTFSAHR